ncbi:hypothetical protein ACOSQ2_013068 [Xanthoceras sorbifolium]
MSDDPTLEICEKEIVFNPEGMRVLAIDANVVSLAYLVAVLKKCKYQVTATTKADEALEILRNSKVKYDLVTTDVVRLDMDGFRLLEIVSLQMDVPVILVTAEDSQSSIMKGIKHGARDYLLKPVRIQEIKNIWQHVVRKRLSRTTTPTSREINFKIEVSEPSKNLEEKVINNEGDDVDVDVDVDEEANNNSDGNSSCQKKARLIWSPELHSKFVNAVQQLGNVVHPKKILEIMNEPGLSRDQVASHLQKYRRILKKQKEQTSQLHLKTSSFMDMKSTLCSARNQELLQLQQPPNQSQPWMMPDVAMPDFKELNFSPTFLSAMQLPDGYMGNSSLSSSGYNVHSEPAAAASSSFPFCSYNSNACFSPPPQVPGHASVQTGAILQHAIASRLGQNSSSQEGGYIVNHLSNSRGQLNDYPKNVQYPTLRELMKNNESNFMQQQPSDEKSQHIQSSFHHNYSSPDDDLTELVEQFANDEPPRL